jgi:hypothetical protein
MAAASTPAAAASTSERNTNWATNPASTMAEPCARAQGGHRQPHRLASYLGRRGRHVCTLNDHVVRRAGVEQQP